MAGAVASSQFISRRKCQHAVTTRRHGRQHASFYPSGTSALRTPGSASLHARLDPDLLYQVMWRKAPWRRLILTASLWKLNQTSFSSISSTVLADRFRMSAITRNSVRFRRRDTCMVEVNGRLIRAYATAAADGMTVSTKSAKSAAAHAAERGWKSNASGSDRIMRRREMAMVSFKRKSEVRRIQWLNRFL
jgi:hypothetical protein